MTPRPQPPFEKCIGKYVFNCFMQIISNNSHQDWRGPFNLVKLVEFLIYDLPKGPRKTQKKLRTPLYIFYIVRRTTGRKTNIVYKSFFFFSLFFLFLRRRDKFAYGLTDTSRLTNNWNVPKARTPIDGFCFS